MEINQAFSDVVEKMTGWVEGFILMLPNLLIAVAVIILFWVGARLVRRLVRSALTRVATNRQITRLLATISYLAVLTAGVFVALGLLQLDKTVTSLLAGVGIIGLALGFAFQDLAANFMAGILLSVRTPFHPGQIIETNDIWGVVEEINLRSTRIRTPQGQIVYVPNKDVFDKPLINFSETRRRRIDLSVGVSYGDDLNLVKRVAVEAIESVPDVDQEKGVELFYKEFGGSSINFVVRYWIDFEKQTDYLKALSEGIIRIKKAFDDNGITIPFPIRTLDFGIVGGEKLSDVLPERLFQSGASRQQAVDGKKA